MSESEFLTMSAPVKSMITCLVLLFSFAAAGLLLDIEPRHKRFIWIAWAGCIVSVLCFIASFLYWLWR